MSRTLLVLALAGGLAAGGAAVASADGTSPSPSSTTAAPDLPRPAPGDPAGGADGRVTAVSSDSLTVVDEFGSSSTYALTSDTTVHRGPDDQSASDVVVGQHVHVRAAAGSDDSDRTAADIDVLLAHLDGTVQDPSRVLAPPVMHRSELVARTQEDLVRSPKFS